MSTSASDIDLRIGARIRGLRVERGLTLAGLARAADVSRAMLSRIERGESSPTAQLLGKICGGLGITLSGLFAGAGSALAPLARRAEQPVWRDPASGYLRRQVSPAGISSAVDIVEVEFPRGGGVAFGPQRLDGAEQQIWVLDGTLDLELDGEATRLEAGDCLRMQYGRPILFRNPTDRAVRYAVIVGRGGLRA